MPSGVLLKFITHDWGDEPRASAKILLKTFKYKTEFFPYRRNLELLPCDFFGESFFQATSSSDPFNYDKSSIQSELIGLTVSFGVLW